MRHPLQGDVSLKIAARTARQGPLQFKFTIFPGHSLGAFEVTLSNLSVTQGE